VDHWPTPILKNKRKYSKVYLCLSEHIKEDLNKLILIIKHHDKVNKNAASRN